MRAGMLATPTASADGPYAVSRAPRLHRPDGFGLSDQHFVHDVDHAALAGDVGLQDMRRLDGARAAGTVAASPRGQGVLPVAPALDDQLVPVPRPERDPVLA